MREFFRKGRKASGSNRERSPIRTLPRAQRPLKDTIPSACPICLKPASAFVADHCHASGKSREWLCGLCNSGLGFFKDNPEALERAAAYLRKHAPAPDATVWTSVVETYRAKHPKASSVTQATQAEPSSHPNI